jgi:hypothetical protein
MKLRSGASVGMEVWWFGGRAGITGRQASLERGRVERERKL